MATKFNSAIEQIFESSNYIETRKRSFYPRGLTLSEDYIAISRRQHKALVDKGIHPKDAAQKMAKALMFHLR